MILVKDLYNKVSTITGFPVYSNETDTPDINRFILHSLSEGLNSVIDDLYLSDNILERTDTIVTIPNRDKYGIEGVIKNLQLVSVDGIQKSKQIRYDNLFNKYEEIIHEKTGETEEGTDILKRTGEPQNYVIDGGYLRLLPMPDDKKYTLKVTVSTTDLVVANNDVVRTGIEDIDDSVLGNNRFGDLVVLKTAELIFARCRNANSQIYGQLYEARRRTFRENDRGTMESQRLYDRRSGHYNPERGLLG